MVAAELSLAAQEAAKRAQWTATARLSEAHGTGEEYVSGMAWDWEGSGLPEKSCPARGVGLEDADFFGSGVGVFAGHPRFKLIRCS